MKRIYLFIFTCYFSIACAESGPIESDKLSINVITHDGNPSSWLRFYTHDGSDVITISLNFNLDKVKTVIVTDEYASENRCGPFYQTDRTKNIVYLAFDTGHNLKNINTRIDLPCLYEWRAKLTLRVKTADNREYYNTQLIPVDPRSSAPQIIEQRIKNP